MRRGGDKLRGSKGISRGGTGVTKEERVFIEFYEPRGKQVGSVSRQHRTRGRERNRPAKLQKVGV